MRCNDFFMAEITPDRQNHAAFNRVTRMIIQIDI
jgi:hypothetical protein